MLSRALTMRRLFCALVALAVAAVGLAGIALIDIAATAASSPGGRPPGEVVCHTLAPGERDAYVFAKCTNRGATGGSAKVNFGKLFQNAGNPPGQDVERSLVPPGQTRLSMVGLQVLPTKPSQDHWGMVRPSGTSSAESW